MADHVNGPHYTPYHPRWYRPRVSTWWWLKRASSVAFILRELSSVFVAWFVIFLLMLVSAVSRGAAAYQEFLAWAASPALVITNAVSLAFVLFHTVTWFNLAPSAMVVRVRGRRVPAKLIALSNYVAWVVVSVAAAWVILGSAT